jgi:hypothetical protein
VKEPGLLPPATTPRSTQIRKAETESCTVTGARTNQSCYRQDAVSGFKMRPGASNRRMMIENTAVTVNAVLIEVKNGCLDSKILFSIECPVFH